MKKRDFDILPDRIQVGFHNVAVLFPAWGVALLAVAWLPLVLVALSFRAGLPE